MAQHERTAPSSDVTMVARCPKPCGDDDAADYENRLREAREHGGECVARLTEGGNLYAADYPALYRLLAERGIPTQEAWLDEIPCLSEFRVQTAQAT
jgi:hypothetical protein